MAMGGTLSCVWQPRERLTIWAPLDDRPDHLAGHGHLTANAVAVDGPVTLSLLPARSPDKPGDERAVAGREVEIAVAFREREDVERVDVAIARDLSKPAVGADFCGDAGVDHAIFTGLSGLPSTSRTASTRDAAFSAPPDGA